MKVLYIGHLKNRSYGDEIAWYLFREFVTVHYPQIELKSVDYRPKKALLSMDYDFYVMGGGTALSCEFRAFGDQSLYQLACANKRYAMFGTGVYYDKGLCSHEEETRKYIMDAEFMAVRDAGSRDCLNSLAPDKEVRVLYDPGLGVRYAKIPMRFNKPVVGINLAEEHMGGIGTVGMDRDVVYRKVYQFIKKRSEFSYLFIPFNKMDKQFFKYVKPLGVQCVPWGTPDKIAGYIQNCDYFIGIRVHSDVTCAAYEIPFLSITYTYPNRNFLDHIEYKHLIMSDALSKDGDLELGFEALIRDREGTIEQLSVVSSTARKKYMREAHNLCQQILRG